MWTQMLAYQFLKNVRLMSNKDKEALKRKYAWTLEVWAAKTRAHCMCVYVTSIKVIICFVRIF